MEIKKRFNGCKLIYNQSIIKNYSNQIINQKYFSIINIFNELLVSNPTKTIAINNRTMTYLEIDKLSNKIARWGLAIGLASTTSVPLILDNCPEYISVWLGLSKIGVTTALIPTTLSGKDLINSISMALQTSNLYQGQSHTIIVGNNYKAKIDEIKHTLAKKFYIQYCGYEIDVNNDLNNKVSKISGFNATIKDHLDTPVSLSYINNITYNDTLFYLYYLAQSENIKVIKLVKISHLRFTVDGYWLKLLYNINNTDSIYIPISLSCNTSISAISLAFQTKLNIALRNSFSAPHYFSDCHKFSCNIGVYNKELCNSMIKTNPSLHDTNHPVKLLLGSGLNTEIWKAFITRFGINIGEFYYSIDGNIKLFNTTGKIGAIGYLPWSLRKMGLIKILKLATDNKSIIRNKNGRCLECNLGETGVLISKSNELLETSETYETIKNVFKQGDVWIRTGELVKRDKSGYFYFNENNNRVSI